MKTFHTALILVLFHFSLQAQSPETTSCDCKTDLEFIDQKIRKMPSFKKQIKGEKLVTYEAKKISLLQEVQSPVTVKKCFIVLNELLIQVKDKHAMILHNYEGLTSSQVKDEDAVSRFRESEYQKNHPKTSKSLDELKEELATKNYNDLEGIYNYGSQTTVALYKTNEAQYEVAVLETSVPHWNTGEILAYITQREDGLFDMLRYPITSKKMQFLPGILHSNGRLLSIKKSTETPDYTLAPSENSKWEFKTLQNDVQYLYFGSFSNAKSNVETFKTFYADTKDKINAKTVIVDLRNNTGGNSKYSDPFVKLLKKTKAKVFVITNFFTGSNGEQMTLKLINECNATHLGQRTMGTISYGINYGNTYDAPSGHFSILPTDMNFHKFIEYEYKGVEPATKLSFDSDWIDQTLTMINGNTP